jgi:23S rRNA pseudouridine1911/1915/1917 synthase
MKQQEKSFVFAGERDARLDMFLLENLNSGTQSGKWTRSQIKILIESGQVKIEGKLTKKAGTAVKPGTVVNVIFADTSRPPIKPWDVNIPVIFEDKYLIAVNKPPGISMHPGAGKKDFTLVNALAAHFNKELISKDSRAGVVHRLDKDTSGVVILAKNVEVHDALSRMFAERKVKKTYIALVLSTPRSKRLVNKNDHGTIETNITRDPKSRVKMSVSKEKGKSALTSWKVKERMSYSSLLEIDLLTGRTHQIRVHFNYVNSPVIGDKTYGDFSAIPAKLRKAAEIFGRQALHAELLEITHPVNKKLLKLKAPLPDDMLELINEFRKYKT